MASSPRIDPSIAFEIDRLATAVAKDPRSKDFLPLADEYIKAGMWQEAAAVLEDGLKAYPGFVTAMAALGRVYDQLGQPVKSKAILEDVVRQRPDNLRAHRVLAKLYHAEGQADLALRSCGAILAANPSDEEALALKRRVIGTSDDLPPANRGKTRAGAQIRPATGKVAQVGKRSESASHSAAASTTLSPEQTAEPPSLKHAATIARLEGWLRTIHAQRRIDPDRS